MAGVVPDDIARENQTMLGKKLAYAEESLARLNAVDSGHRGGIEAVLQLVVPRVSSSVYPGATRTGR